MEPNQNEIDREVDRIFWAADKDRTGRLTKAELHTSLAAAGYHLTWEQLEAAFSSFNDDADHTLTFDEYLKGMGRPEYEYRRYAIYRRVFDIFDTDHTGFLQKHNLERKFVEMRIPISGPELDRLCSRVASGGGGHITFRDFLQFFFDVQKH